MEKSILIEKCKTREKKTKESLIQTHLHLDLQFRKDFFFLHRSRIFPLFQ